MADCRTERQFQAIEGQIIICFEKEVDHQILASERCSIKHHLGQSMVIVQVPVGQESEYANKFTRKKGVKFAEVEFKCKPMSP